MAAVRRVARPEGAPVRVIGAASADLAWLDRVDALEALYGVSPRPWTWSVLEGALQLLGTALRDDAALGAWIQATAPASWERRAGVVALGLLGSPLLNDLAVEGHEAWRVQALASILACGAEAGPVLEQLGRAAPAAAGSLMLTRSRLQQRFLLGACES